jgi:hypothetical protein
MAWPQAEHFTSRGDVASEDKSWGLGTEPMERWLGENKRESPWNGIAGYDSVYVEGDEKSNRTIETSQSDNGKWSTTATNGSSN